MKSFFSSLIALACVLAPARGQEKDKPSTGPGEITVQAYVDGSSAIHLSLQGLYWTNGGNAKPGKLDGNNFATYINGKAWFPKWGRNDNDRGKDRSDVYPLQLKSTNYEVEVVSVSIRKDTPGKERRTTPIITRENAELVINIPDPESGARWYELRLNLRKS